MLGKVQNWLLCVLKILVLFNVEIDSRRISHIAVETDGIFV